MKLMLAQVARWLATAPVEGHDAVAATGYSIDSRTVQAGELFFAIRGERFDGHDFVAAAFERGAIAAVVARGRVAGLPATTKTRPLLVVDNPQT